ncbi:MAG: hypothetical protein H8K06_18495 [Nitrospira sp.]|nr:hypothetical protein [Nitrospira sp.]
MKTMTHVLAALAVLTLSACSHSPTATKTVSETEAGTRTGMVRNIVINETIHPETLTVRAGDEIRWINQRQDAVTITIDQALDHTVSCRNGFRNPWGWESTTAPSWRVMKRPVSVLRESARSSIQSTHHPTTNTIYPTPTVPSPCSNSALRMTRRPE